MGDELPPQLPPVEAFSFKSLLDAGGLDDEDLDGIDTMGNINADLDRIAEICARSRLSLSNQYEVHVAPHGSGASFLASSDDGAHGSAAGASDRQRGPVSTGPTLQAVSSDDERRHRKRRSGGPAAEHRRRHARDHHLVVTVVGRGSQQEEERGRAHRGGPWPRSCAQGRLRRVVARVVALVARRGASRRCRPSRQVAEGGGGRSERRAEQVDLVRRGCHDGERPPRQGASGTTGTTGAVRVTVSAPDGRRRAVTPELGHAPRLGARASADMYEPHGDPYRCRCR